MKSIKQKLIKQEKEELKKLLNDKGSSKQVKLFALMKLYPQHRDKIKELDLPALILGNAFRAIKFLVEELGIDINSTDNKYQTTPLSVAVRYGKKRIISYLLKQGADINLKDKYGRTVFDMIDREFDLPIAIKIRLKNLLLGIRRSKRDYKKELKDLLKNESNSMSARIYAASLLYGFQLRNDKDDDIREAIKTGDPDLVRLVLDLYKVQNASDFEYTIKHIEDLNRRSTFLHYAAEHGNKKVIEVLLERGANINSQDYEGLTPIMEAVRRYREPEIIKYLLEKGSDIKIKDSSGRTVFIHAVKCVARTHNIDAIRLLLEAGTDPINEVDSNGNSAYGIAKIRNGSDERIKLMEAYIKGYNNTNKKEE